MSSAELGKTDDTPAIGPRAVISYWTTRKDYESTRTSCQGDGCGTRSTTELRKARAAIAVCWVLNDLVQFLLAIVIALATLPSLVLEER